MTGLQKLIRSGDASAHSHTESVVIDIESPVLSLIIRAENQTQLALKESGRIECTITDSDALGKALNLVFVFFKEMKPFCGGCKNSGKGAFGAVNREGDPKEENPFQHSHRMFLSVIR